MSVREEAERAILAADHEAAFELASRLSENPSLLDEDARQLIGELYQRSDDRRRRFIVTSLLEHLFENERLSTRFRDWEGEPALGEGVAQAKAWAEALRRKRRFLLPIAEKCATKLRAKGFAEASVEHPPLGVDSVGITWTDSRSADRRVLVLDCEESVARRYETSWPDDAVADRFAELAADSARWRSDDYSPSQYWCEVRDTESPPSD